MTLLYCLIAALIVVILVVAYVALGRDRFAAAWAGIPGPWRTVINVTVGSGAAVVGPEVIDWVTHADLPPWLSLVLVPFLTAAVRALNPGDGPDTGGYGRTVQGEVVEGVDNGATPPVVE